MKNENDMCVTTISHGKNCKCPYNQEQTDTPQSLSSSQEDDKQTEPVGEEWKKEFDVRWNFGGIFQNREALPHVKSFIARLLEEKGKEACEAGKLSVHSKDGSAWDAGREAGQKDGYQKGFEDGRKGFEHWVEEGKKEATARLVALAEGMKERTTVSGQNVLEAFIKLVSKE